MEVKDSEVKYRVKGGDVYPVIGESQTGEFLVLGDPIA